MCSVEVMRNQAWTSSAWLQRDGPYCDFQESYSTVFTPRQPKRILVTFSEIIMELNHTTVISGYLCNSLTADEKVAMAASLNEKNKTKHKTIFSRYY